MSKYRTRCVKSTPTDNDNTVTMPTRIPERTLAIKKRQLRFIENASPRNKRAWISDMVTSKILSSIDVDAHDYGDPTETYMIIGKWHDDGHYWSGMLHKFMLDLLLASPKESGGWRADDISGFNDAWAMMDSNHNINKGYHFSWLLHDHLGVDREFLRDIIFWGLETCGIITDRLNVQSTILSQWEAESGGS